MNATLRRSCLTLLSLSFAVCPGFSLAQTYPTKAVRVIVPFAPGGATDAVLRMLAPRLSENLGQQVVVENRPGGAATIGMDVVARSAPDGYTMGVANLTFSINPILLKKMPYDSDRDFALVSHITNVPFVLTVHPSVPAKSVKELVALAKARPGALNYSSSGPASATQMSTELFNFMTGTKMLHIPFTGGGPAIIAALSGEVSVYIGSIPTLQGHFKAGRLRPLGVTTAVRDPAIPEVPTIAEAGVPGYEAREWQGIVVRAGTPPAVVARLNQEFVKSLKAADMNQRLASVGAHVVASTPEEFAEHIKKERDTWAKVIKAAGIRTD